MRTHLVALVAMALLTVPFAGTAQHPVESRIPIDGANLYARAVGDGQPAIVLHGGPDFDHLYLLPDFDQYADVFRLIYYDQRGRGRSADGVRADDVTLASELEDVDRVRQHYGLERVALIGHSWGIVLALEYALRHPERVSRLILMNPAPASADQFALMRTFYLEKLGPAMDRQSEIATGDAYRAGDPEAVIARYRIHFRPAFRYDEPYERLMVAMADAFRNQGSEGILKARAVEDRLMEETWLDADYDLLRKIRALRIPTLVVTADSDFIPVAVAEQIGHAIPDAQLVTLRECGHFSYMECPDDLSAALRDFLRRQ